MSSGSTGGTPPLHGSFVIRRDLAASAVDVHAAFVEPRRRSLWVRLPGTADPANDYTSAPGATEVLRSVMRLEDRSETIERRTRLVESVSGQRVVFIYEAVVDDVVRWVSLVTVLVADSGTGCSLTWVEQYALLAFTGDGSSDVAHLRGGTELHLNGLPVAAGGSPSGRTPVPAG